MPSASESQINMTATVHNANESRNAPLGIMLILTAVFFFASMDVATKYLALRYNAVFVVTVRYILGLVLMTLIFWPKYGRDLVKWQNPKIVLARGFLMVFASLMATFAFQRMPVAETVAIVYLSPFVVLIFAKRVLGEHVSLSSWIATIGGFLGLLLIVRPGGGLSASGVGFALASAFGASWYFLLTRKLAQSESTIALLYSVNLVGAVIFTPTLFWTLPTSTIPQKDLFVFFYAASAALIGHFLATAAFREATATILAPMQYVHLIWAGLLGWAVFDQVPSPLGILGILLIAFSGSSLTAWTQITGRRKPRPPAI